MSTNNANPRVYYIAKTLTDGAIVVEGTLATFGSGGLTLAVSSSGVGAAGGIVITRYAAGVTVTGAYNFNNDLEKALFSKGADAEGPGKAIAKFDGNCENHLAQVEGFSQKRGISGGHNLAEFETTANAKGVKVVKEVEHPNVPGVKEVEYQVPTLDAAGNPTGGYKATSFTKTVYDPKVISDTQMAEWGKQAAQEAMSAGRIGSNGRVWEGFAPNGLKFRGYLDADGTITNFFPTLN